MFEFAGRLWQWALILRVAPVIITSSAIEHASRIIKYQHITSLKTTYIKLRLESHTLPSAPSLPISKHHALVLAKLAGTTFFMNFGGKGWEDGRPEDNLHLFVCCQIPYMQRRR